MKKILVVIAVCLLLVSSPAYALLKAAPTPTTPVNVSSATGTLPVANGGTGATTSAAAKAALNLPNYYVMDYSAKCDGRKISGVSVTSGAAVLSSTNYTFVAGDVGKYVTVPSAAVIAETGTTNTTTAVTGLPTNYARHVGDTVTAADIAAGTTIAAIVSSSAVTLSQAATGSHTETINISAPLNATIISVASGNATLSVNAGLTVAPYTTTASTTSGSSAVTALGVTTGIFSGEAVSGTNLGTDSLVNTVTSSTAFALNTTATATGSTTLTFSPTATFGTDDSTAINNLITTIAGTTANGGLLVFPAAMCVQSASFGNWTPPTEIGWQGQGFGNGGTIFKQISTSDQITSQIQATNGSANSQYKNVYINGIEFDDDASTQSSYNYLGKNVHIKYVKNLDIEHNFFHGSPATSLGIDYISAGTITLNKFKNCAKSWYPGNSSGGGACIGVEVGFVSQNAPYSLGSQALIASENTIENYNGTGIAMESGSSLSTSPVNIENNVFFKDQNSLSVAAIADEGLSRCVMSGNNILGSLLDSGAGIASSAAIISGNVPGRACNISLNTIATVGGDAILIDYTTNVPGGVSSDYLIATNTLRGNGGAGIRLISNASTQLLGAQIKTNNIVSNGLSGIRLEGAAGFKNITLQTNEIFNNGVSAPSASQHAAISMTTGAIAGFIAKDNNTYDTGGGTQTYGLYDNGTTVTGADIENNTMGSNATGAINIASGTITGVLNNNQGASPSITDTATNKGIAGGVSIGTSYVGTAAPTNGMIVQGGVSIGTSATPRNSSTLDVNGTINVGSLSSAAATPLCLSGSSTGTIASCSTVPATSVTATPTAGTNVTSCTCATAGCTNLRGSLTIVGGTATTGTICSLAWTATPTAYVCTATMNGGATALGIGNSVATTTGMNITSGVSVTATTLTANYSCVP